MLYHFGTPSQKANSTPPRLNNTFRISFGLTEIHHGSDTTHMNTVARPVLLADDGQPGYEITSNKKWQSGMHTATHMLTFLRTSGVPVPQGV